MFLCLGTCITVFACLGIFFNFEVTRGVVNRDYGIAYIVSDLLDFTIETATAISLPLAVIATVQMNDSIVLLDVVSYTLSYGLDGTIEALDDLADTMEGYETVSVTGLGDSDYTSPDMSISCDYCVDGATDISDAADELQGVADEMAGLNGYVLLFTSSLRLTEVAVGPDGMVSSFQNTSLGLIDIMEDSEPILNSYIEEIRKYDGYRSLFTTVVFCIFLLGFIFSIFASIFRKGAIFNYHLTCMLLLLPIVWLMFGIHLPLAVIFGDSCNLVAEAEADPVNTLYWCESTTLYFETCLANASLAAIFNLTTEFDLATIELPELSATELLESPELTELIDNINAISLADLGIDSSGIDSLIDVLNSVYAAGCDNGGVAYDNYPTDGFERTTLINLEPTDIPSSGPCMDRGILRQSKWDILTAIDGEAAALDMISGLQNNTAVITDEMEILAGLIDDSNDSLDQVLINLTALLDSINALLDLLYCGDIGTLYGDFVNSFCSTLSTAMVFLSFSLFGCGIFTVIQFPLAVHLGILPFTPALILFHLNCFILSPLFLLMFHAFR